MQSPVDEWHGLIATALGIATAAAAVAYKLWWKVKGDVRQEQTVGDQHKGWREMFQHYREENDRLFRELSLERAARREAEDQAIAQSRRADNLQRAANEIIEERVLRRAAEVNAEENARRADELQSKLDQILKGDG